MKSMSETIVPNIRNTETVRFCSLVQAYLLYVVKNLRKISGFIYSPIHMLVQLYRDMLRFSCKVFYYESNILFFSCSKPSMASQLYRPIFDPGSIPSIIVFEPTYDSFSWLGSSESFKIQ